MFNILGSYSPETLPDNVVFFKNNNKQLVSCAFLVFAANKREA